MQQNIHTFRFFVGKEKSSILNNFNLQPIIISKSRLNKFFNLSELPSEIGGLQSFNHDEWLRNRVVSQTGLIKTSKPKKIDSNIFFFHFFFHFFFRTKQQIDEFRKHFESILASIKSLKENLANTSTMRASEIEQTIKICNATYAETQKSIKTLLDNGEFNYLITLYQRANRV